MSIIRPASVETRPYVNTSVPRRIGVTSKCQILPYGQHEAKVFLPTVRTLSSTFPSTVFASAGKASSLIPKIDYIKHLLLKVDISVTAAPVTLVHSSYWFRQQDLRHSSTGQVIQSHYDDSAEMNLLNRCSAAKQRALFKTVAIESDGVAKYGLTKPLPIGTHTFYVPLLTSVFENFGGLFLQDLEGDLALDLTTPSTIIASGAGAISASISFVVEGADLSDADATIFRSRYKAHAAECQFLEPVRTEFYSKQLTAGSSNNDLKLDNVNGLCAYQAVIVRPTGSYGQNAAFAQWRMLNLGDANGAGIDLVTSSGKSLWGNGSPVPCRHIRQHQSIDNFDNDWVAHKPCYFLNYSDSMNAALGGRIQGGYKFVGQSGDQIRLSLPAAPVAEVHTVSFFGTPSSGFYRFRFRGEDSVELPVSASAAVMKTAIETMRGVSSKFLTVTCSGAASAGVSFTITITDPEGTLDGDLIEVVSNGLGLTPSTMRTTAGIAGLATGAYDIFVYSFMFHQAGYSNNKLSSQLLMV